MLHCDNEMSENSGRRKTELGQPQERTGTGVDKPDSERCLTRRQPEDILIDAATCVVEEMIGHRCQTGTGKQRIAPAPVRHHLRRHQRLAGDGDIAAKRLELRTDRGMRGHRIGCEGFQIPRPLRVEDENAAAPLEREVAVSRKAWSRQASTPPGSS